MNLLFFGNDGNLIRILYRSTRLNIVGIIAEPVSNIEERYFGSAYTFAKGKNIPLVLSRNFRADPLSYLKRLFKDVEVGFLQGYLYRIPKEVIQFFPKGIINFHQSYLPAYRSRHPLNWAIINGEKRTGVSFHLINGDFDAGKIILQRRINILRSDSIMTLYQKTVREGIRLLPTVLKKVIRKYKTVPQRGKISYYPPRKPEDGEILPVYSVRQTIDLVRALVFPYPGAFYRIKRQALIIEKVSRTSLKFTDTQSRYLRGLFWYREKLYLRLADGYLRLDKIRLNGRVLLPPVSILQDFQNEG